MPNKLAVAGPDSKFKQPEAEPAGFWAGVWHGLVLPITFVVSLFKPEVGIYETHNNGGWYNLGFVLGAASSLGGGNKAQRAPWKSAEDKPEDEPEADGDDAQAD